MGAIDPSHQLRGLPGLRARLAREWPSGSLERLGAGHSFQGGQIDPPTWSSGPVNRPHAQQRRTNPEGAARRRQGLIR